MIQGKVLTLYNNLDTIRMLTHKKYEDSTMHNDTEKRKHEWIRLERRKYKRIEIPCLSGFQIRSDEAQEIESADWYIVTLMNISAGGTFFYTKKDLGIDTVLDLKIDISKSTLSINCVGKIKRIEEPIPPSIFGIAIEFTGIDEQEKEMINKTAEEFLE